MLETTETKTAPMELLFTQNDVEALIAAARSVARIAPKFAGWILAELPEMSEGGTARVELPKLPTRTWTDGDVADTLVASFEMAAGIGPDAPAAAVLATHLHMVTVYLAHQRMAGGRR